MSALRELQQAFAQAIWQQDTQFASQITTAEQRRLAIYRQSVLGNLVDALAAVYPVIQALVGELFFRAMARRFATQTPSTAGDLHQFGADFADFIATFPPAAQLPYLPDTARLEWAWHRAFHAAESLPLDLTALAAIPSTQWDALQFQLAPSAQLVASAYPIHQIWAVNQADYQGEATVDLQQGGVCLLVIRRSQWVELVPLTAGDYALLSAFQAQHTFAKACQLALAAEPGFALNHRLQQHVQQFTVTGFHLET